MTSIVVNCNWTSATALVTSTPQCHHICFTTCLPPLPRDLSSIVTSAAVSIMLNLRSKTKWHWAEAPLGLKSALLQYFFKNSATLSCCAALYAVQMRIPSSACARLRLVPANRSTFGSKNALTSSPDFSSQKAPPTNGKNSPNPNVDPAGILATSAA